jgi:dTDP-4-dehydrorhamnose 3,5-epimerase
MNFISTKLEGCFVIEPKIIQDSRGYFMETFNENVFQNEIGKKIVFVQDNQSFSSKGVLRGFHYQTGDHAQAKLVRVLQGENQKQFFIPRGFAHGFLVLSETATFFYKCDNFYNKESEGGIIYNDPALNIDWQFPIHEMIISEKDQNLPTFENAKKVW